MSPRAPLKLECNLRELHGQMRAMRYRHQPIRRVHIPKDKGRTRPIGISCIADKVVQGALCDVLEAIYEPVFFDGSYGFRCGRSAHDALRALNRVLRDEEVSFILKADIVSFFDSIVRKMLMEMFQERVVDTSFLRLVGKCLHVEQYVLLCTSTGSVTAGMKLMEHSCVQNILINVLLHQKRLMI